MPEKVPEDTTSILRSPMPGTVITVSVKAGDTVNICSHLIPDEYNQCESVSLSDGRQVFGRLKCFHMYQKLSFKFMIDHISQ